MNAHEAATIFCAAANNLIGHNGYQPHDAEVIAGVLAILMALQLEESAAGTASDVVRA